MARARGWDTIVDAASFAPTNRLDLKKWHPDFVPLSFYKMFGYPTGLGCLLARREALAKLERPWFAGGTVLGVSVANDSHYLLDGAAAFEDGTVDYLNIPAVEIGLKYLAGVGMDRIHDNVIELANWMFEELLPLRHDNGTSLIEVYGPRDCRQRGATLALNVLDPTGRPIDERIIERTAQERKISVRTGCFCNPGGFEGAWNLTRDKYKVFKPTGWQAVKALLGQEKANAPTMQDYVEKLKLPNAGAVRVSLGVASTKRDVSAFVSYAKTFLNTIPDATNLRPRMGC